MEVTREASEFLKGARDVRMWTFGPLFANVVEIQKCRAYQCGIWLSATSQFQFSFQTLNG